MAWAEGEAFVALGDAARWKGTSCEPRKAGGGHAEGQAGPKSGAVVGRAAQRSKRGDVVGAEGSAAEDGVGGGHAGFDGQMDALELQGVHKAGGIADDGSAGKREFRDGVPAAFRDEARAVFDGAAAGDAGVDEGVAFPAAEQIVEMERRVGIIESQDEADGDVGGVEMVDESAAVMAEAEGVAEGMQHGTDGGGVGGNFDDFLEADAVGLEIGGAGVGEAGVGLAREEPGGAVGQDDGWGEDGVGAAAHARDAAVFPNQRFGGLAPENFHAERFGDSGQGFAE